MVAADTAVVVAADVVAAVAAAVVVVAAAVAAAAATAAATANSASVSFLTAGPAPRRRFLLPRLSSRPKASAFLAVAEGPLSHLSTGGSCAMQGRRLLASVCSPAP